MLKNSSINAMNYFKNAADSENSRRILNSKNTNEHKMLKKSISKTIIYYTNTAYSGDSRKS